VTKTGHAPGRTGAGGVAADPPPAAAKLRPAPLLVNYQAVLRGEFLTGPVLDIACGAGHNGLYLASCGASVRLVDRDETRLAAVRSLADQLGLCVDVDRLDLESGEQPVLPPLTYGTVVVFRYLHRPLIPSIKETIRPGGILMYETYTVDQRRYGRPRNPAFLLEPGELRRWFENWEMLHAFEGELQRPRRAVAQLVCRKPINR
jgi:tellurite methyltransferase